MENVSPRSHTSPRRFFKKWRGIVLAALGLALIVAGVLVGLPRIRPTQAANTTTPGDWPMYMYNTGHTSYNNSESIINLSSASHLKQHWVFPLGTAIFSQPVEASGLVYWGSFDGYEHATNMSGHQVWAQKLGGAITACGSSPLGIVSSASVVNGVVYVGGSDHNLYALNASTGQILWHTLLGAPNSNTFLWDSPMVVNGTIYLGTATAGEAAGCQIVQGQLFEMSASNGAIEHTFDVVPNGCVGGPIWGSPTYDAWDGSIYITTGNQGGCKEPYAVALVKLRSSDLTYESSWQVPLVQRVVHDADFGTTPVLFTATINGAVRQLVGVAHKDGSYYAFDRTALSNGPVWTAHIAIAGNSPDGGQGSISPAVWWGGGMLYVAGGKTTINGQACGGSLRALNTSNGSFIWQHCLPGTVLGAVTDTGSRVLAVVDGSALTLVNALTGATLYNNTANKYYGSPSISNGVLYVGSVASGLYAFGL
jgi:outer membrane protein assembly factor BamB